MNFNIAIKETYIKYVKVEASGIKEALNKVEEQYDKKEIILDKTNLKNIELYPTDKNKEN